MQIAKLEEMVKGWFVGDFSPAVLRTADVEVAVKTYRQADREDWHYHKVATEVTCVVSGEIEMCERRIGPGNIIVLSPGEGTSFLAVTDAVTVVVKHPGAKNDKFLRGE